MSQFAAIQPDVGVAMLVMASFVVLLLLVVPVLLYGVGFAVKRFTEPRMPRGAVPASTAVERTPSGGVPTAPLTETGSR